MSRDIAEDKSKTSLFSVLSVSLEELGEEEEVMFLCLVVLARGVWASTAMLATLWEKVRSTRKGRYIDYGPCYIPTAHR